MASLPIIVQTVLLLSLFLKYRYTKLLLEIWLVVFFLIAPGLQIAGKLLRSIGDSAAVDWPVLRPIMARFCVGVIFLVLWQRNIQDSHKSRTK